jgi:SAM-dependent methyltransferase
MVAERIKQPEISSLEIMELKRKHFMFPHFVDGIINGKFKKLPIADVRKITQENHFKSAPLTTLTEEEESLIETTTVEKLYKTLNGDRFKPLCEPIYLNENSDDTFFISLYTSPDVFKGWHANDKYGNGSNKSSKLRPLSLKDKLKLFFNPQSWIRIRVCGSNSSDGVTSYGNRDLLAGDGYFRSALDFQNLLTQIRSRTNEAQLRVLDIGCGMGKALQDMKDIDPNLETHGITMEQEPAMFNADFFHYLPAERMPAEFKGKFHLITSNIAIRYFLFQHIALRNIVKALAKGGQAKLAFAYDRIPETPDSINYFAKKVPNFKDNYDAMGELVGKEIEKLKKLEKDGKIKLTTSPSFEKMGMQGSMLIEKIDAFDDGELDDK